MKKFIILFIFNLLFFSLFSINTSVSGIVKGYAGKELSLKTYTDEIVFGEKTLASALVDSLGNFSFHFELDSTATCFIEIGSYHGLFFVEPGKNYAIELPPFKPMTKAENFNPYFKPEKFFLKIKNGDETGLNRMIVSFEDAFNYYYVKSALSQNVDTIKAYISEIQKLYPDTSIQFFQDYKDYKYALMANLNEKYSPDWAISSYVSKTPVSYHNMAFWETFNAVFDDFFNSFQGKMEQQYINKALNDKDYIALCAILKYRFLIENKALQELVIIKGLYDAYFSPTRNPSSVLSLMNNWKVNISTPENIAILDKMIEKLTEVAVSSEAFNFNLPDEKGKYHQLSDYKGKYVYINFCNTQISLSKKDFGILAKYSEAYKKDLFVINIFTDENQSVMNAYVQNNKQTVINLYWNNDIDLIKKYHVINIPTYYLIDREGKFLLSPAPTPDENFEQSFEQILAKDKLKEKPEEPKDRWWE